ncbi:MAG: hypothetical protein V4857_18755 [Pseudomonadota bacterium]
MQKLSAVVLAAASVFGGPGAHAAPLPADHPILGIWRLTLPDGSCSETYRFRSDGTTLVTSADEISESTFDIPVEPSSRGYYRLVDTVVKDNGKKDCAGQVMQVGKKITNFVVFHPSGALFLMCEAEALDKCIGPFHRVNGLGT